LCLCGSEAKRDDDTCRAQQCRPYKLHDALLGKLFGASGLARDHLQFNKKSSGWFLLASRGRKFYNEAATPARVATEQRGAVIAGGATQVTVLSNRHFACAGGQIDHSVVHHADGSALGGKFSADHD
jgi:hypothetical protein